MGEFEQVLKLDPDNAIALRGLGYAYLRKHDFHRAGECFQKAAEKNSKDPRVLYYSALLVNREERVVLPGDADKLRFMQRQLEASIALDPDFADAYSLLALTYTAENRSQEAVKAMSKAADLDPRNENYAYNLSQMYAAGGQVDKALPILERLKNSSNPQIASAAAQSLMRVQEYKLALQARTVSTSSVAAENKQENKLVSNNYSSVVEPQPVAPANPAPARFLKGTLVAVDCSSGEGALLTITAGGKTWKMHTAHRSNLIVIGADDFSCAWKNRKVAINYHQTGDSSGEMMSLELQ
jgi:Flp pilus assembly protein TadD